MKSQNTFFTILLLSVITLISYGVSHALFSDTASSTNNTFIAADTFPGVTTTITPTITPTVTPTATPTPTSSPTPTPTVGPGDVVINELMWMGSSKGSSDEWIELKNTTDHAIPIDGWQLTKWVTSGTDHEDLMTTIPAGKSIPAGAYFLIAQSPSGAPGSALNVDPDVITTNVVLSNTVLQVRLFVNNWDSGGMLIDTAGNKGAPLKGEHETSPPKKFYSMERNSTPGDGTLGTNWHTATTSVGFDVGEEIENRGTPKSTNSLP